MANNPMRRAQLISPFGTGAMVVVRDGTSLIAAGIDHWYEYEDGDNDPRRLDLNEYRFEEWRLQQLLEVSHFRLPPDYRRRGSSELGVNMDLKVPFLRFPQWHFCPWCKRLEKLSLATRGAVRCPECEAKGKRRELVQVPFIAMCDHGHLQDLPWREWVHQSISPICEQPMRLKATGGASLGAQLVICACGAKRSLAGITNAKPDGTETDLSKKLDVDGRPYTCTGQRPWLGTSDGETCGRPLRGSLRSAANVYFADMRSAIYLPRGTNLVPSDLVELLESPPLSTLVRLLSGLGPVKADVLRSQHTQLLQQYTDAQITQGIQILLSGKTTEMKSASAEVEGDDRETAFRREEFRALREPRAEDQLTIRQEPIQAYQPFVRHYFSRIMLISRLRETRALAGFTRIFPENELSWEQRRSMLWRYPPRTGEEWLPAYMVYGEGLFLELNEELLQVWEQHALVKARTAPLIARYQRVQQSRHLRDRPIGPRFLLLHTLAHLIMNRLTFECGYSSAALRERLYVSTNSTAFMAGLLIYTAAGDAEGTMGGLVRMGKPGLLEPVIRRALEEARWCSADPVCMEIGAQGGQGPDSCNLAACHNCALVPETACEEFNRFLDRGLVVGALDNRHIGFFRNPDRTEP